MIEVIQSTKFTHIYLPLSGTVCTTFMKKKILIALAATLLLFNGIGALYGGSNLILHPDGSSITLDPHLLDHSPFQNFLIPGIVLLLANGVFSFWSLVMMAGKNKNYPWYVTAQGVTLAGWLVVQMILIRTVYFLHFIMGSVAILLILVGLLLVKTKSNPTI